MLTIEVSPMMNKSVLLLGSYGQSNLGDDLLMWNYLELLRKRGFRTIYVNANTAEFIPKPVREKYPDLQIIDTYHTTIFNYIKFIKKVDCIVYGGGTLYKELYASTGRSKYSVVVRMMGFNVLAKILGTKLYHLNIGIGSLKTRTGRFLSKIAISAATTSIFRDQRSYDYAKDVLKVSDRKIEKSTDGLFLNPIWKKPWRHASLRIDKTKYKQVVGVNVLSDIPDWVDRDHYIQVMQQFVIELLDAGNYVIFVPLQHRFNPRNDLVFTHEMFDHVLRHRTGYKIIEEAPIDLISSYLQQCDVFVGMRFHSLLLATVNKVPFVAVAYDTKCWRFIEEVEYTHAIKIEDLELDALQDHFRNTMSQKMEIKRQLGSISDVLYAEAEEDIRNLNL